MRYDPSFGRRPRLGGSGYSGVLAGMVIVWLLAVGARAGDFVSVKTGNWFTPSTWGLKAGYPFTGDNVLISSNDNVSLIFSNSLDLQINNLVLSNSILSMSSSGGQGFLAIAGADSEWTNATLGGLLLQLGTLDLLGTNGFFTGTTLTNQGIIHQIGAGYLKPYEGDIVNRPNATYDFAGDGTIYGGLTPTLETFVNRGTLLKSSGVNTSSIAINFVNADGTIEVDSGTLSLSVANGGPPSTNATFVVAKGATLDLPVPIYWAGKITGSGAGQVVLNGGTLAASPVLTLDLPDRMFEWTGGGMAGIVTNLGVITLAGTNIMGLPDLLVNAGLFRHTSTAVLNINERKLQNLPGATYDLEGDGNLIHGLNTGTFENQGLFRKSGGAGVSSLGGNAFDNVGGTIEVDAGTLVLSGGNSSNGTFQVAGGASLDLTGGGSPNWKGEISGSGAGHVILKSGSFIGGPAAVDLPAGMFQFTGGSVGGIVTNLGVMTLSGDSNTVTVSLLVNAGLFRHTNNATLHLGALENLTGATYDLEGNGHFIYQGFSEGVFKNWGLFRKSGGAGVSSMGGNDFDNYGGTIEADSGTLQFALFNQTGGATRLAGGNLTDSGTFNFNGGLLTGVGSITGAVFNAGAIVHPGNVLGALDIFGDYSQRSGGALDIALGGTNAGEFSRLVVSGGASLAGALNLFLANGYTPAVGDRFQILSCSNRSGTFKLPPAFPTGISVTYSNSGVYLDVTGPVVFPVQFNPPTVNRGGFHFGFQTVSGQRYTVQRSDDLTTTNWIDFTNFTGDGSLMQFVAPATNVSQRFFRVNTQ